MFYFNPLISIEDLDRIRLTQFLEGPQREPFTVPKTKPRILGWSNETPSTMRTKR